MEKTITYNYNGLRVVTLTVYGNGACDRSYCYEHRTRETINKIACYYPDSKNNFISELSFDTRAISITPKSRLFVAGECKVSRDTLRNSGYSIVRDKNKADIIVVPDIIPHQYEYKDCNMVAINDEKKIMYIVTIVKYGYGEGEEIGDNELQVAKNFLESSMKLTVFPNSVPNLRIWFLPKCEELTELMTGKNLNVPYVQGSKVPIVASTKISPETLVLWENIEDKNLFVRTICTSNWTEYPITILTLVAGIRNDVNWYNFATEDFRRILKSIDYNYNAYNPWYSSDEARALGFLQGKQISTKDYDMLQRYIYCRFGVDENGGLLTPAQWESLPFCIRNIMSRRISVKPFTLPTKMTCQDLIAVMRK